MKKLFALVLAAALLLGASALGETVNLTAFQYELANQEIDFANLWYFQQIEAETGVHVDFVEVKDADFSTQLGLMFASGDYEDMIIRGTVDDEDYGVSQGLLLPLDDYLESYMPNYYSRLFLNNADASIYASDGKMYYIGYMIAQNVNHQGTWYINQTWLNELGLAVPTTVEELTAVLYAFKEAHPDSTPLTADFPTGRDMTENINNQFAMFGVPENGYYYFIDDTETVQFTGYQDGWYDCVEWLHQLYADGILDQEVFTQDSNAWGAKVNAGTVGYTTYLREINTAWNDLAKEQMESMLPPAAEGYKAAVSSILEVPDQGARLTAALGGDETKIKAALTWLDAQFETEKMMEAANGPIGGDGPIEDTMFINDKGLYEVKYVPENNGLYSIVPVTCGQFFAPGDYYTGIYQMAPHRIERYEDSKWYAEAGVLEYKSFHYLYKLVTLENELSIESQDIFTDLDKYIRESFTNFVINGIDEASYAEFIETCKGIGVDRYIEIYQDGYNAYLAK